MKKGFTMIELIFVIVILGILASVAIPKLYGTKTEAEIAKVMANIKAIQTDLTSYYLIHGSFATSISDMTNVPVSLGYGFRRAIAYIQVGGESCIGVAATNVGEGIGGNSEKAPDREPAAGKNAATIISAPGNSASIVFFNPTGIQEEICMEVQSNERIIDYTSSQYEFNGSYYWGRRI